MTRSKSHSSQDNPAESLKTQELMDIISAAVKQENNILREEIRELKQEVVLLRESNIELINLLTNTSNFSIPLKRQDTNEKNTLEDNNITEVTRISRDNNMDKRENDYSNIDHQKALENREERPKASKSSEVSNWSVVKNKERAMNNRLPGIIGTGNNKGELKAIEKKVTIYVSRLHPDTTLDNVETFLKSSFPEANCEMGHSKYPANYSSFKITINENNYNHIMNPNIWPNGAYINRFFRKKQDKYQNNPCK